MRLRGRSVFGSVVMAVLMTASFAFGQNGQPQKKPDYPPFDKVSEGFEKVVSTADGKPSLYTIFKQA